MLENLPNRLFDSIDDFVISEDKKPLGTGSFGIVKKAKHKMSGREYAIKIITIDKNKSEAELLLLNREISIHYSLDHPHIIKLWSVLSAGNKIYMIMDYAQNGNLFNFLVKKKGLNEQVACKYFYQVVNAVEYMHKNDVFHRDIKPENILLDSHYNVKICDFGWVADEIHRKRNTFCGTYEYMSPEMVSESLYDYKIDIWALGVLLFQLIHCRPPFPASSLEQLKIRFSNGIYEIKQKSSEEYKKLMVALLQFDPKKRIETYLIKKSDWVVRWTSSSVQSSLKSTNEPIRSGSAYQPPSQLILKLNHSKQNKAKRGHKKYRTLEQEDLYCLGHNASHFKSSPRTLKKPKEKEREKQKQNQYPLLASHRDHETIKKKVSATRIHTRTESNDLLLQKFGKMSLKQRVKQKKKKPMSKRI